MKLVFRSKLQQMGCTHTTWSAPLERYKIKWKSRFLLVGFTQSATYKMIVWYIDLELYKCGVVETFGDIPASRSGSKRIMFGREDLDERLLKRLRNECESSHCANETEMLAKLKHEDEYNCEFNLEHMWRIMNDHPVFNPQAINEPVYLITTRTSKSRGCNSTSNQETNITRIFGQRINREGMTLNTEQLLIQKKAKASNFSSNQDTYVGEGHTRNEEGTTKSNIEQLLVQASAGTNNFLSNQDANTSTNPNEGKCNYLTRPSVVETLVVNMSTLVVFVLSTTNIKDPLVSEELNISSITLGGEFFFITFSGYNKKYFNEVFAMRLNHAVSASTTNTTITIKQMNGSDYAKMTMGLIWTRQQLARNFQVRDSLNFFNKELTYVPKTQLALHPSLIDHENVEMVGTSTESRKTRAHWSKVEDETLLKSFMAINTELEHNSKKWPSFWGRAAKLYNESKPSYVSKRTSDVMRSYWHDLKNKVFNFNARHKYR